MNNCSCLTGLPPPVTPTLTLGPLFCCTPWMIPKSMSSHQKLWFLNKGCPLGMNHQFQSQVGR